MDRLSTINAKVKEILELNSDLRISIAHRLMMKLEEKKDITRWEFWDRVSVKEHGEDIADKGLSEEQVDKMMEFLNEDWNKPRFSVQSTEAFTEALGRALKNNS